MEFTVTYDRCVWTTGKVNVIADTEEDAEKMLYDMECNGTLDRNNEIVDPNEDKINVINVEAKEVKSTYRIHYAYMQFGHSDVEAITEKQAIALFNERGADNLGGLDDGFSPEEIVSVELLSKKEEE